ncbi:Probable aldo-keto reductase 5 [Linum grandiflorum]
MSQVGELKKLIDEGKIKYIGLSVASAATITRAHGDDVCPIPGTTKIENLDQNLGVMFVKLSQEDMPNSKPSLW